MAFDNDLVAEGLLNFEALKSDSLLDRREVPLLPTIGGNLVFDDRRDQVRAELQYLKRAKAAGLADALVKADVIAAAGSATAAPAAAQGAIA